MLHKISDVEKNAKKLIGIRYFNHDYETSACDDTSTVSIIYGSKSIDNSKS
jgi:hypothetical protein